jgi:SOS-response transcriptional repressor LexA
MKKPAFILMRQNDRFVLAAANPAYSPLLIDENVTIIGRVVSVVRHFK